MTAGGDPLDAKNTQIQHFMPGALRVADDPLSMAITAQVIPPPAPDSRISTIRVTTLNPSLSRDVPTKRKKKERPSVSDQAEGSICQGVISHIPTLVGMQSKPLQTQANSAETTLPLT